MTGAALCKPRGRVDNVARGHALAGVRARVERDQRLARRDPDAELEAFVDCEVADRERCAHRPLGIVLVCGRRAEERHDGVADELLDRPAVALELVPDACVVRAKDRLDVLGVERLRPRGEADEVAEDHGDDLALAASCALRHGWESTTWTASSLTSWRGSRTRRCVRWSPRPTWSRSCRLGRSFVAPPGHGSRAAARSTRRGRRRSP